jgi:hypothetical protein
MDDYPFDLGPYSRPITTSSPEAQRWFDRGLNWTYGFNHEEAATCFKQALHYAPDCAIAHWGVAYVIGPNYNKPWELFDDREIEETLAESKNACATARATMAGASPVEQALITALELRYRSGGHIDDLN